MSAANSAVKRKARAASEGASEESRLGQVLAIKAYQSETNDDEATVGVESTTSEPRSSAGTDFKEAEENKDQGLEDAAFQKADFKDAEHKDLDEDKESVDSHPLAMQRSKSESESDTSSKKAVTERKGFLKFNLLRKKMEAGRSASSTPDSERPIQSRSESPAKKWRSWGRRTGPKDVEEGVDKDTEIDDFLALQ